MNKKVREADHTDRKKPAVVKCASCGYLAVRHLGTQDLVSPGEAQRASGMPPESNASCANLDKTPICAKGAILLSDVLEGRGSADAQRVMHNERNCSDFTKWIPGLSPNEHISMNFLEKREQFHRKCQQEDQQWREKQAAEQQSWIGTQARHQKWTICLSIVALVLSPILTVLCQRWIAFSSVPRAVIVVQPPLSQEIDQPITNTTETSAKTAKST